MTEGPPTSSPLVFVDDISAPELNSDDRHHLSKVLRVRDGDAITLSDGLGSWRSARMGDALEPLGPIVRVNRRDPQITIAFALIKGERPELVVQKLTELGVDKIVPFTADRSVARWTTDRAPKQIARLRRIAREASMQSRRCWLPEVCELISFEAVVALPGICAAELGGAAPSLEYPAVMIGPEGGWSDDEMQRLPTRIGIGDHVLRAETAAITAAALLTAMRANLVSGG